MVHVIGDGYGERLGQTGQVVQKGICGIGSMNYGVGLRRVWLDYEVDKECGGGGQEVY